MKIEIKRIAKRDTYTISKVYIRGKYFCDALEPRDRGWTNEMGSASIHQMRDFGHDAIPTGIYTVHLHWMNKLQAMRPQVMDVPGFNGIFFHEGNTAKDTRGCILLGENSAIGFVGKSKAYIKKFTDIVTDCEKRQEKVELEVL